MLDTADHVSSIVVAVFGVVGAGWAVLRYLHRPRFMCGVPPTKLDLERGSVAYLGRPNIVRVFDYDPECFPKPLRQKRGSELPDDYRHALRIAPSSRWLEMRRGGTVVLPVVLVNVGARSASGLNVSAITDAGHPGDVGIVDVETETLECHVFANDPGALATGTVRRWASSQAIVDAYRHHLSAAKWHDGIWLCGSLDAHTFDLTVITLRPKSHIRDFRVIYTVNCDDGWTRSTSFVQAFNLDWKTRDGSAERATELEQPTV